MSQNSPVIVGVGQYNPRRAGLSESPEPLEMMALAARAAAEDSRAPDILKSIGALAVLNVLSFSYSNAPGALAAKLGIQPRSRIYTTIGGNTPLYLLNHLAAEIEAGRLRSAMIVGAEAFHTLRRAMKQGGVKWGSAAGGDGSFEIIGDPRNGTTALEERYGGRLPVQVYPLFENARRARHTWSIEQHRAKLGRMCAAMTRVAAKNPYAWFPQERTADEITTISAGNRMIGFPYPKLMNSIIDVDLAAAVIITSEDEAQRLKIAEDRRAYVVAGADATEDGFFVTERDHYHGSPAMKRTFDKALELAGVGVGDISAFDFYSCFPAAVGLALDALGLDGDDPRGVTVTGGLPYAGGPGNNYVTHSIAAMAQRLRGNRGKIGMVTGLGWYFTKHSAAIFSAEKPATPFQRGDAAAHRESAIPIVENADGPATIETYTVMHDRVGDSAEAIIIGRLEDGPRFLARAPRDILGAMETEEFVGRRGKVRSVDGVNLFDPS